MMQAGPAPAVQLVYRSRPGVLVVSIIYSIWPPQVRRDPALGERVGRLSPLSSPQPIDPAADRSTGRRDILVLGRPASRTGQVAYYGREEAAKDDVGPEFTPDRKLREYLVNMDTGESPRGDSAHTRQVVSRAPWTGPGTASCNPFPIPPHQESDFAGWTRSQGPDPDWRAAMDRRGYHDLSRSGRPDNSGRVRSARGRPAAMVRVRGRSSRSAKHDGLGASIDGVAAYVDLIEKKVFKVTDEFELRYPWVGD